MSARICRLLSLSVMKRPPVVLEQTFAAVDVYCVTFPAGVGAGLSTLLRPGSVTEMVPAEAGCSVIPKGGSAARAVVPGARARVPGAGPKVGPLDA
jgi:hypothetical protein